MIRLRLRQDGPGFSWGSVWARAVQVTFEDGSPITWRPGLVRLLTPRLGKACPRTRDIELSLTLAMEQAQTNQVAPVPVRYSPRLTPRIDSNDAERSRLRQTNRPPRRYLGFADHCPD